MSSIALFDAPDMFEAPPSGPGNPPGSLLREMADEVGRQLLRRFMASFGSGLALADGVALYAGQVRAARSVYDVTHNRDGSPSRNPVRFGFVFESLVAGEQNRDAVVSGSGEQFERVDHLYLARCRDGKPLPHADLNDIASFNNTYTDVVGYDENGIRHKQQLKAVKDTRILLEERYTISEDPQAPDEIVVPADDYDRHRENLERMARSSDPELAVRAEAALGKLRRSGITREQTRTAAAYAHIAGQALGDGVCRAGERVGKGLLAEAGLLIVGGAVWELRDAAGHPASLTVWQRFERFLGIFWKKLSAAALVRCGREFALEALNMLLGALRNVFASAGRLLSALGQGINTVWESLYDYLTGKISSFSQLVAVVLKTLTTVGIGTLAFALEQELQALGVPGVLGGLLAAALAGVAVVFANRGIDAAVFTLANLFSCVEVSRLRRDRIGELCREAIPCLRARREALEADLRGYYRDRESLFRSSFTDFRQALASRDSVRTFMALESFNQAFGCTLGWKTGEDFDAMMKDDDPLVL